jgi:hypothetical protein
MQDQTQNDADVLVDTIGAAQFIGMSAHFVVKHSSGGAKPQIAYLKMGNRLRFRISSLKDFVAARTKKG